MVFTSAAQASFPRSTSSGGACSYCGLTLPLLPKIQWASMGMMVVDHASVRTFQQPGHVAPLGSRFLGDLAPYVCYAHADHKVVSLALFSLQRELGILHHLVVCDFHVDYTLRSPYWHRACKAVCVQKNVKGQITTNTRDEVCMHVPGASGRFA